MKKISQKIASILESIANNTARWMGSVSSIIVHTLIFIFAFSLYFLNVDIEEILLVVTTVVSLEAIYLAIFIQMSVNQQSKNLKEVAEDIDEIQEDVDEIQEDVEEIQENVDEIQVDVDEIQEDVEEIEQEIESEETSKTEDETLSKIQATLAQLAKEISELKKK